MTGRCCPKLIFARRWRFALLLFTVHLAKIGSLSRPGPVKVLRCFPTGSGSALRNFKPVQLSSAVLRSYRSRAMSRLAFLQSIHDFCKKMSSNPAELGYVFFMGAPGNVPGKEVKSSASERLDLRLLFSFFFFLHSLGLF